LFVDFSPHSRRARARLRRVDERARELHDLRTALDEKGALPFFSFGVHFADTRGAFDLILSNPPWVRAHRWPDRLRRLVARHYEVCRTPGWPGAPPGRGAAAAAGAQVDLALLFLERAARLLAPGGVLAMLLPAKALRALYGGPGRRILLRDLDLIRIEDHALDHRSIFRADAFAAVVIARKPVEAGGRGGRPPVQVRMVRRGVAPVSYSVPAEGLPLVPGDEASPWLLAPGDVAGVLRTMQRAGPPLGHHPGMEVRRGVMTGANPVLVLRTVEPRLGGIARVEAEGFRSVRTRGSSATSAGKFRAFVETDSVRPLVRGGDVDAFSFRMPRSVVWCHDGQAAPRDPGPRMARYLARHRSTLEARSGWKPGLPLGSIFRLSPATLGPKVAWHDLSDTLRATALPATVLFDGRPRELVPLNTVYFIPVHSDADARMIAALFNSLPVRTFARAIAERAKDARFRFFAWTLACLPLPTDWTRHPAGRELAAIATAAHRRGGILPAEQVLLDRSVAALYGLDGEALETLSRFDRWLLGTT
jgi:hypothetical protein